MVVFVSRFQRNYYFFSRLLLGAGRMVTDRISRNAELFKSLATVTNEINNSERQ